MKWMIIRVVSYLRFLKYIIYIYLLVFTCSSKDTESSEKSLFESTSEESQWFVLLSLDYC